MKMKSELLKETITEEEKQNKVASLIEKFRDTPFLLVEVDEGYFLAHGQSRITDVFSDKIDLENYFDSNFWEINGAFVVSLVNSFINLKNEGKL